ncbi:hypothetical protein Hanom_Chr06g00492501 [Helianthus anomalus]
MGSKAAVISDGICSLQLLVTQNSNDFRLVSNSKSIYKNIKQEYLSFAETSHANEAVIVVNGHDAGNNGTSNSNLPTIIHKFEKIVNIVEKLSDNHISSCINLKYEIQFISSKWQLSTKAVNR